MPNPLPVDLSRESQIFDLAITLIEEVQTTAWYILYIGRQIKHQDFKRLSNDAEMEILQEMTKA
jgi:hypothetical protein